MMKPSDSYFSGYHVYFIFLQVITSTSENLMVTTPTGHLVATVGGQAELGCQVSPPRSVEDLEVRWFRGDNSKLIYRYRGSHGVDGEAAPEYVNRTEFVKVTIREGKVALRIHNIGISDDGPYRCSFNDGSGFSEAASVNLSVAAFGLKTQIRIQSPGDDGLAVECFSEGWFPRPRMEWRDSKGKAVPYSSISYSQDGDRFFHMRMTLVLRNQSQESITCCVRNSLTGEEKETTLILANVLFNEDYYVLMKYLTFSTIPLVLFLIYLLCLWFKQKGCTPRCRQCSRILSIIYKIAMASQFSYFIIIFIIILSKYLQLRNRDPLFSLYNSWMLDIARAVCLIVVFIVAIGISLWISIKFKR